MKQAMSVRLTHHTMNKLNIWASSQGLTRQELVEKILTEATMHITKDSADKTVTYVSNHVLELIKHSAEETKTGSEVSLKNMVGEKEWEELTDSIRRVFGKQFREMVAAGDFPELRVGRKRSNNEQQYIVN